MIFNSGGSPGRAISCRFLGDNLFDDFETVFEQGANRITLPEFE
jgi:hypothetical protein